jgi:hypothetical protein
VCVSVVCMGVHVCVHGCVRVHGCVHGVLCAVCVQHVCVRVCVVFFFEFEKKVMILINIHISKTPSN